MGSGVELTRDVWMRMEDGVYMEVTVTHNLKGLISEAKYVVQLISSKGFRNELLNAKTLLFPQFNIRFMQQLVLKFAN